MLADQRSVTRKQPSGALLLVFLEPTTYLTPLWREIRRNPQVATRIVFLAQNISQPWNIELSSDERSTVLEGNRWIKLARLARLIAASDVRGVHLAGWGHPLLFGALVLAILRRLPVTVQSDSQHEPSASLWRRALKRIVLPLIFRWPRTFLPGGTRQAAYLQRYGVPEGRIRIAQMTVDVQSIMEKVDAMRAAAISGCESETATTFLYVGRLELIKGVTELLQAFAEVQKIKPNARLTLAGDGSLRERVAEAAKSIPGIDYRGRLSGRELIAAYACAHVFVLPSRVEPWGLTVNEAMAASLPIIVSDRVGCVDDLVRDGLNGRIVPSGAPLILAAVMLDLIENPARVAAMGRESRKLICNWTVQEWARRLADGWEQVYTSNAPFSQ